jgi:arginase family enzyme
MAVPLSYVPFIAGEAARLVAQAPARYAHAGAERLLAKWPAASDRIRRRPSARSAASRCGRQSAGQLPLVLAGSCDAAIGVVAGLDPGCCGVVWAEAHAGFDTPQSSASGYRRDMCPEGG